MLNHAGVPDHVLRGSVRLVPAQRGTSPKNSPGTTPLTSKAAAASRHEYAAVSNPCRVTVAPPASRPKGMRRAGHTARKDVEARAGRSDEGRNPETNPGYQSPLSYRDAGSGGGCMDGLRPRCAPAVRGGASYNGTWSFRFFTSALLTFPFSRFQRAQYSACLARFA